MIRIHFVGGEKGGVGKSVLARVLAQYHIDRNKPFTAFDGDLSHGALVRYYGDYAKAVDLGNFESADQIAEVTAELGCDVIVDLAAQSAQKIDRWMAESGLLELAEEIGLVVTLWHVMDDGSDSVRLLEKTVNNYGSGLDYILVRNHGRGSDFSLFDNSQAKAKAVSFGAQTIDLPKLHAGSMLKIDRVGASLWSAANNQDATLGPTLGLLERQRVKVWLNKSYAELDRVLEQSVSDPEPEMPEETKIKAEIETVIAPDEDKKSDLTPSTNSILRKKEVLGYASGFFNRKNSH
ncbi:hypothetical protein THIOSC13_160103 [uncultured Thiomicrorhabdus sp.]